MRTTALVPVVGIALLALITLGGCKNDPLATDFNSVKNDPTPELVTLNQRDVDVDRAVAVTSNVDSRMFWMDVGRALYLDRPSSLSPYYIVPTSGQPR